MTDLFTCLDGPTAVASHGLPCRITAPPAWLALARIRSPIASPGLACGAPVAGVPPPATRAERNLPASPIGLQTVRIRGAAM
jgi:hypothetical protein